MRLTSLFALVISLLIGCGEEEETSASDLFTVITMATGGKCNFGDLTHRCRITMLAGQTSEDSVLVAVTTERVWVNPGDAGTVGEIEDTIIFEWNPRTDEVIRSK